MYNFEIQKKFNRNTGQWIGTIRILNNDEDLTNNVIEFYDNINRDEHTIYDVDFIKLDERLENILSKVKEFIDHLRKNKKIYEDLGNSKQSISY